MQIIDILLLFFSLLFLFELCECRGAMMIHRVRGGRSRKSEYEIEREMQMERERNQILKYNCTGKNGEILAIGISRGVEKTMKLRKLYCGKENIDYDGINREMIIGFSKYEIYTFRSEYLKHNHNHEKSLLYDKIQKESLHLKMNVLNNFNNTCYQNNEDFDNQYNKVLLSYENYFNKKTIEMNKKHTRQLGHVSYPHIYNEYDSSLIYPSKYNDDGSFKDILNPIVVIFILFGLIIFQMELKYRIENRIYKGNLPKLLYISLIGLGLYLFWFKVYKFPIIFVLG